MAKDKPILSSEEKAAKKAAKKAKKESSEKKGSSDGVHKSSSKDKASKTSKLTERTRQQEEAEEEAAASILKDANLPEEGEGDEEGLDGGEMKMEIDIKPALKAPPPTLLLSALVPFANPLADEKVGKKVLRCVRKANKAKTLKRGVKEVVKSLRKSAPPSTSNSNSLPTSIVILAADISPMDVLSHLPVLCEDHSVPYIFVTSRAELGAASLTKRPTSVVMVGRERGGKKGGKEKDGGKDEGEGGEGEEGEKWAETYAELVKVVVRAGRGVRV